MWQVPAFGNQTTARYWMQEAPHEACDLTAYRLMLLLKTGDKDDMHYMAKWREKGSERPLPPKEKPTNTFTYETFLLSKKLEVKRFSSPTQSQTIL